MKIKKNDMVMVIAGNSKGKSGKVLRVYPEKQRLIIEGVNLVSRHRKPTQTNPQGGIMRQEAPIHISNVMLIDSKSGEPTRIGKAAIIDENTGKTRFVRRSVATGETIE
ncbi:MAG: 50S ribosomal protein L24 [Ignavibacteria bacterium]|nr:MAG: 50S ribosomal protein L24 [Ignavibacteria bacterium]